MYIVVNELTKEMFKTESLQEANKKFMEFSRDLLSGEDMSTEHHTYITEVHKEFIPSDMKLNVQATAQSDVILLLQEELIKAKKKDETELTHYDIGQAVALEYALNLLMYPNDWRLFYE